MKPVKISQIKPGNLVNGIRKTNFGKIILKKLVSPKIESEIPDQTIHFGNNFINPAVTDTPAIRRPSGTEYPTPPIANDT